MKQNKALKEISELISGGDKFLIVTHVRPDGDAVGSVLGLQNALREAGKNADAFFPDELPGSYDDYTPSDVYSGEYLPNMNNYSYVIALDTSNTSRLGSGKAFELNKLRIPVINIDHHPDNEMFGTYNYAVESAATAAIILDLIKQTKLLSLSAKTATLLMFGIVADTGAFRYDNTTPRTLRDAADLLESGADHHTVITQTFFSKPLNYAQFEAELLALHLKTAVDDRFAWFFIEPELIEKYDIDLRNAEGLIEILRQLDGTDIVAIITLQTDKYKISLRSKDQKYSVGAIARQLNGGGHEMAAGCSVETENLDTAEKQLLALVKATLN